MILNPTNMGYALHIRIFLPGRAHPVIKLSHIKGSYTQDKELTIFHLKLDIQRKSSVILFASTLLSVKFKTAEYQEKRNKASVTFPWEYNTNKLLL